MGISSAMKRVRDIGVPAEMPPEEAKYIRQVNVLGGVYLALFAPWFIGWNIYLGEWQYVLTTAGMCAIFVSAMLLNHLQRFSLARSSLFVFGIVLTVFIALLSGKDFQNQYYIILTGATAAVFFTPRENRLMVFMILLSVAAYLATTLYLYGRFESLSESHPLKAADLRQSEYFKCLLILLIPLVARFGAINAESRLKEQRERLAEANEKITRISEKLKIYLPRQFVDSLATGERESGPVHRRRRLTIMFSDVQGFTMWTDKLEPEELREILNNYLCEMSSIAHKWGGTIDKFIGDCLMIFFGDPEFTSDKDHALRCVKMAIEMQERMKELRKQWENHGYCEPLHIRIGINTGWATVGDFGCVDRLNYTALGSAVNLASRLESASAPDRITISHTTYSLVKEEIQCEPKEEIEVKGFSEPIRIYEVLTETK